MTQLELKRFEILRSLSRYEDAYKKAMKLAVATSADEIISTESALFEIAKDYKDKIRKLRHELKELK